MNFIIKNMARIFMLYMFINSAYSAARYSYDYTKDSLRSSNLTKQEKYNNLYKSLQDIFEEELVNKEKDHKNDNAIKTVTNKKEFELLIKDVETALDKIKDQINTFHRIVELEIPVNSRRKRQINPNGTITSNVKLSVEDYDSSEDVAKTIPTTTTEKVENVTETELTTEKKEPVTTETVVPEPVTPELATPELATLEPATPELATPELATPELVTPESVSSKPVKENTVTEVSGRRMLIPPNYIQPSSRVKDKLLSYLDETFNEVERKIKPLKNIKIALSNDDHYKIGYIIATIDTLEVNLKKLKNDMVVNQQNWDEQKILDLFDRIKATNTVTSSLIESLKSYLPKH